MFPRGVDQWHKIGWILCVIVDTRISYFTISIVCHYEKSVRIRSYSDPHFPAFGLNNSEMDTLFSYWCSSRGCWERKYSTQKKLLISEQVASKIYFKKVTIRKIFWKTCRQNPHLVKPYAISAQISQK